MDADHAPLASLPADAGAAEFAAAMTRAEHGKERVFVMRDGQAVAALVPIEDVEALEDAEDERLAAEELAKWEAEGRPRGIPLADIARELNIDLAAKSDAAG